MMNVMARWKTFQLVSILPLAKVRNMKTKISISSSSSSSSVLWVEQLSFSARSTPLHFPLASPSFCLCFLTFLSHKLERLMNCLGSWLSSCCRVGPSFPLLSGMSSIQPEIMLAIGGICVNPVPVPVSQQELSFRDEFYADNYPNQSSIVQPAWQPVHYIVSVSPL